MLLFFALLLSFRFYIPHTGCVFVSFTLFFPSFFTIHSGRRRKPSHPIEIIPETAGEIKKNKSKFCCYCAPWERVSRHFTTGPILFSSLIQIKFIEKRQAKALAPFTRICTTKESSSSRENNCLSDWIVKKRKEALLPTGIRCKTTDQKIFGYFTFPFFFFPEMDARTPITMATI